MLVANPPGKYICLETIIDIIANIAAPNVLIMITFLLSYKSETLPIGNCAMAPEIANRNVTIDISNMVKFIEVAYTARRVKTADWIVP